MQEVSFLCFNILVHLKVCKNKRKKFKRKCFVVKRTGKNGKDYYISLNCTFINEIIKMYDMLMTFSADGFLFSFCSISNISPIYIGFVIRYFQLVALYKSILFLLIPD